MIFKKEFFKLMNNVAFGKTVENVRKHLVYMKLLVSELNYHATKLFTENLMPIEMKKLKCLSINLSIQDFQNNS